MYDVHVLVYCITGNRHYINKDSLQLMIQKIVSM